MDDELLHVPLANESCKRITAQTLMVLDGLFNFLFELEYVETLNVSVGQRIEHFDMEC